MSTLNISFRCVESHKARKKIWVNCIFSPPKDEVRVTVIYSYADSCRKNHNNDTIIIKTREDFFRKICTSHFIVRVWKGLLKVLLWEGAGDWTELQYIDPHSYGRQRYVFLVLLMLNWRPGGSAFCWVLAFSTTSCHQQFSYGLIVYQSIKCFGILVHMNLLLAAEG